MNARKVLAILLVAAASLLALGQQPSAPKPAPQPQSLPDAPSSKQKPQDFPPPSPYPPAQTAPERDQTPPAAKPADSATPSADSTSQQPVPPSQTPSPGAPQAMAPKPPTPGDDGRDQFTIPVSVNFVVVPVTVKDQNGLMVDGLLRKDFSIYEDGVPQQIQLFTSDPFPLSAAVVIDTGIPDSALEKVQNTLAALAGAFSQFDELSVYVYGNAVQRLSDFTAAPDEIAAAMRRVRYSAPNERRQGAQGGVPMAGGPLNSAPSINGRPIDPGAPIVPVVRPESHVLNDAILEAALDLAQRDKKRRRMLFVISDGMERGSRASYADVLKVLLSREVAVYGLGLGDAAIPLYSKTRKFHIPGQGYDDLLPKYTSATGGGSVITAYGQQAIEEAYARATQQARNQYTIGYTTRATPSTTYRSIEVRVHRPNLRIFTKDGYYPLPPERPGAPPTSE